MRLILLITNSSSADLFFRNFSTATSDETVFVVARLSSYVTFDFFSIFSSGIRRRGGGRFRRWHVNRRYQIVVATTGFR